MKTRHRRSSHAILYCMRLLSLAAGLCSTPATASASFNGDGGPMSILPADALIALPATALTGVGVSYGLQGEVVPPGWAVTSILFGALLAGNVAAADGQPGEPELGAGYIGWGVLLATYGSVSLFVYEPPESKGSSALARRAPLELGVAPRRGGGALELSCSF